MRYRFRSLFINMLLPCLLSLAINTQAKADQDKQPLNNQLQSVIVTAQKRSENLQDVAISMDVFSGMQIEDAHINELSELTQLSPNLFATPSLDNKSIVIRGISTMNTALSPAAGLFINDISYPINRMQNPELVDIERVEILRGPQGTLYGKNTESGAVNIVTKQPDNEFRGKIFGEYGFYNAPHENVPIYRAGGSVSTPIKRDKVFMGLAFQTKDSNGYMKNLIKNSKKAAKTDHKNGQMTLRWTPLEKWDISFIANISENNDGLGYLRYDNQKGRSDHHTIKWNGGNDWKEENNSQVIRAQFKGKVFDFLSITSRSDYRTKITNDADFGPFDFGNQDFVFDNNTLSQEIRLSSPDSLERFKWICGIFGSRDKTKAKSETPAYFAVRNTDFETENIAAFGQGTYTFFDRLHLTAGMRLEYQQSEGEQTNRFAKIPNYSRSEDNHEFLPKGTIAFDITENAMTYFTASKGFLSGGYNFHMANGRDDLTFHPEHVINYEIGFKTEFFHKRLIINAAAFHLDIKDKQVIEWPSGHSPMAREVTNAAEASSKGFELEIKSRPLRGLDLFAGLGYTESKFDNWIATLSTGGTFDYKDNYLPYVPRYTYNTGIQYRYSNGLFMRADVLGTGEFYTDAENTQKVKAYETINLKLGFESENYDIAIWCKNLMDKEYITSKVNYFGSLVNDGAPRSCGVTLTYRF